MENGMTRRTVVRTAAVLGAMAATGAVTGSSVALAADTAAGNNEKQKHSQKPRPTTANGWPVQINVDRGSQVWTRSVAGTGLSVPVWIGDPEAILLHVVRRYHYEVTGIRTGELAGWQQIETLDVKAPESNLASGTAVRIRPGAATKGSLFPLQEIVVRDILADCEGVVRWGGDDSLVDESLFYLDRGPADPQVRELADNVRRDEATPGQGAGKTVNVMAHSRRERANRLAGVQGKR
ncbi:hypothetical protein AB0L85_07885 [Streptomyces sp. NPDC052051]|uniref:hypothetical protein n=1 Tax=Streptomyces sp. NPDC052051 TaxID=3154649 RepID=UPI00342D650A